WQGESRGLSRRRRINRRAGLHRHATHANRRRAQRAHRAGRGRERRERQHRTGGWPARHHAARPIQRPHAAKAKLKNTNNGARWADFRRAPIPVSKLCNGSKAFSSAGREIFRTNVSFTKSRSSRCSRGWVWARMVCRRRADGGRSVAGVFAYRKTAQQLTRLNELVPVIERETLSPPTTVSFGDSSTKTAA